MWNVIYVRVEVTNQIYKASLSTGRKPKANCNEDNWI
jgi:hypothetical protein